MNSVMIDDSILFYLSFENSFKKEIIEILKDFIKNQKEIVSNVYSFIKIQNIFFELKKQKEFYEFYQDCNRFIKTIYPIDSKIYKNALNSFFINHLDFELALYIELLKELQIFFLFSLKFKKIDKTFLKDQFFIEIIEI